MRFVAKKGVPEIACSSSSQLRHSSSHGWNPALLSTAGYQLGGTGHAACIYMSKQAQLRSTKLPAFGILTAAQVSEAVLATTLGLTTEAPRFQKEPQRRGAPLCAIVLLALAIHGPLLFMQVQANSFDTNFHIFFASHYAQHWWNPWNQKWFAGFSQTTYPPLEHQWMALIS